MLGRPLFLVFFIINLFFLSSAKAQDNAQTLKVPEVLIQEEKAFSRPRSIEWTVQKSKATPFFSVSASEESFNSLNGVQSRSQGSPTFSIRGSGQSGRVLLLLNDIPLNFGSGFGAPPLFLPREMIENITVIKGPASLFYGSQAMSGSLNFHTKDVLRPELTVVLSDTDESFLPWKKFSLSQRSLHLATPLISNSKDHLQISYFNEVDAGDFAFQSPDFSGVRTQNASDLSRVLINGHSKREWVHWQYEALYGELSRESPGSLQFPFLTEEETQSLLLSVSPHFFFTNSQSLKSRLSYLKNDSEFKESGTSTQTDQSTFISQNEWIVDLVPNIHLQFFADFFSHNLESPFIGGSKNQSLFEVGPFISFKSFYSLKHQLGARYLAYNEKILPTISQIYEMKNSQLWLTYSQGFRNPTLSDLYSNTPNFIGNTDLIPEESTQWELGYQWSLIRPGIKHNLDLRIFRIDYKNFIETFQFSPVVFSRENRGKGSSQGFDFEWMSEISHYKPYLRYNYLETREDRTGSPFRLSPRHQLTFGSQREFRRFTFEWQNTHWYKNYDWINNQPVKLKDWQQWNFFIHTSIAKNTKLSLGLINAFNEAKELSRFYPEPQRRYWLSFNHIF